MDTRPADDRGDVAWYVAGKDLAGPGWEVSMSR